MPEPIRIVVARGDGIGPEITDAVLTILDAAQVPLAYDFVEIGERAYLKGYSSGIPPATWDVLRANRVLLKGPVTTPQGGGYKSVNVTLRKALGLFANVRQCKAYSPYVPSTHPGMNVVILRENEEDLYAGIEYRQSQEVVLALKMLTRPGVEAIVRYAFEYARAYGRKKVTCMTKDNIMKMSDGMFHRLFDEMAREYTDLKSEHLIIDIGAARLAAQPESLDVIVTLNLYGDILSDIAAQVAGSVGLAGSANVGSDAAMFEAIHGSAPDIAGKDIANPSGMLNAAIQMLVHVGLPEHAERIMNAWLCTLEAGIHTADIYREGLSQRMVGTRAFAEAVVEQLGCTPEQLEPVTYRPGGIRIETTPAKHVTQTLVGVDVFFNWDEPGRDPEVFGRLVQSLALPPFRVTLISNRGVKVFPDAVARARRTDSWQVRLLGAGDGVDYARVLEQLAAFDAAGLNITRTENLYTFDGQLGYSLGQGE